MIGMGIALTGCAGEAEVKEPVPVEQASITEKVVETRTEKESQAEEDKPEETEIHTEAESEKETESGKEENAEKETESGKEANAEKETEPEKETNLSETAVTGQEAGAAETAAATGSFTQADIAVSVRGVVVAPGEIMENYVSALGDPDAYEASPSCVEVGDDKIYTYGGAIIYSCRANGTDKITLIEIKGAETMVKGIHIGDTMDAVIAAYGDSYTMEGNEMVYETNDRVMGFLITDGKVSFMELYAR